MLLSTNQPKRSATLFSVFTFVLLILLLAIELAIGVLAAPATSKTGAISLQVQEFAGGLINPVKIANAGDNRLFVVERRGVIRIVRPDGTVLSTPFLDIQNRVNTSGSERGLLGLVFEPENPKIFYVNYSLELSNPDDPRNGNTIIARYQVSGNNSNIADPNSETVLLEVTQPYAN
ncbi:MAG: PQQ-dependent sugar dehydrogenase, partial [Caldilineaceae bacterium]